MPHVVIGVVEEKRILHICGLQHMDQENVVALIVVGTIEKENQDLVVPVMTHGVLARNNNLVFIDSILIKKIQLYWFQLCTLFGMTFKMLFKQTFAK